MAKPLRRPPRWADDLLRMFLDRPETETESGDLLEAYRDSIYPGRGRWRANLWYVQQVVGYILRARGMKLQSAIALVVGWFALGSIWIILESLSGGSLAWNRHACTFFWCIAGTGSGSLVGLVTKHRKKPMILLYATSVALFLIVLHRTPASHTVVYWIDTIALTFSILVAVPLAVPARQSIAPAGENA